MSKTFHSFEDLKNYSPDKTRTTTQKQKEKATKNNKQQNLNTYSIKKQTHVSKPGKKQGKSIQTNAGHYFYQSSEYGEHLPKYSIYELLDTDFRNLKINNIPYTDYFEIKSPQVKSFKLTTQYPGLIIGIGYSHPVAKSRDNDFQQGFFFDWTTGVPVIPGSSVKGMLRSFLFPKANDSKEVLKEKCLYISQGINNQYSFDFTKKNELTKFAKNLFETKGQFFYDAFIAPDQNGNFLSSRNNRGLIFAEDYITYHENPLKNPVPLRHLKLAPGVTFQFQFNIKDDQDFCISSDNICHLFKQMIMDFGIGAKTNTGYGFLAENMC